MTYFKLFVLFFALVAFSPPSNADGGRLQAVVYDLCRSDYGIDDDVKCSCMAGKGLDNYLDKWIFSKANRQVDGLRGVYAISKDGFLSKVGKDDAWLEGFCGLGDDYVARHAVVMNSEQGSNLSTEQKSRITQLALDEKEDVHEALSGFDGSNVR